MDDSLRGQDRQQAHQDLHPSGWIESSDDSIIFQVQLSGFRAEDIKVQVANSGKVIMARGSRTLDQGTVLHVVKDFVVPNDADIDKIIGKFKEGWLSLAMPKKVVQENESSNVVISIEKEKKEEEPSDSKEQKKMEAAPRSERKAKNGRNKTEKEGVSWKNRIDEIEEWFDDGAVDKLMEFFNKNRRVIAAAAAAFYVGFCVSQKLRSSSI